MLTTRLEQVWAATTVENRASAVVQAKKILGDLDHLLTSEKRRYNDVVEMLAAELLAYKGIECTSDCYDNSCPAHGITKVKS